MDLHSKYVTHLDINHSVVEYSHAVFQNYDSKGGNYLDLILMSSNMSFVKCSFK